jgi:opacity protein-like surface antigen
MTKMAKALCALVMALPVPSFAQDKWEYTASVYGWFSGLKSTVATPRGDLETDLDFSDVWDSLDMAFFGAFEARNGRWSLINDLVYADLSSDVETPFGVLFSKGEVETRMTLWSAYATYAVLDEPGMRFDLGGGFRYNDINLKTRLIGVGSTPSETTSSSQGWFDPLIGARARTDFADNWFATANADIGGFGFNGASDLTWQAYAGIGYRFNDRWAAQFGYRYLSIQREFSGQDVTLDISGPILGVQVSF